MMIVYSVYRLVAVVVFELFLLIAGYSVVHIYVCL